MSRQSLRPARPPEASDAYLEAQYNNRARVPEHPALIAGWRRDADAYRAEAEAAGRLTRVAYGAPPRCTLDLFAPAGDRTPSAALLFVHGGYWQGLEPESFAHLARGLNARGHLVATAGYDLCPTVPLATIVEQIRTACVTLAEHGRRPVVAGHSAGGHLAACMLATDWSGVAGARPQLVPSAYAISGLFDLVPLLPTSINGALRLDEAEAERQSPLAWTPPRGLVLDAVVGGAESEEYLLQSRAIAEAWGAGGVATRYEALADANHFTVLAPLAEADSAMTTRLADLLRQADA